MNARSFGKIFLGILLIVFLISFSSSASSGYTRSTPSYASSAGITSSLSSTLHREMCNAGQDFIVQINPFGCTPAVVRSDLLEEQNVPVFCELGATKLNPLIDVDAIESISFSGQYPSTISGIGFYPAQSALGVKGNLNKPVLSNIGYVVIVLEKQKNSSAIPKFVQGNLTAKIKYDIQNAFGVGKTTFYLPLMDDETWEEEYKSYGFWERRGFLRVEDIQENSAEIVLYDGELDRLNAVELEKGKSSEKLSLPGFDCLANLNLKLEAIENVDTYIELKINDEVVNVKEDELFLDNKCRITDFDEKGITQQISVNCKTDEKTKTFPLKITPSVHLVVEIAEQKTEDDFIVGEKIIQIQDKSYYLGYVGTKRKSTNTEDLFAVILSSSEEHPEKLSDSDMRATQVVVRQLEATSSSKVGEWAQMFSNANREATQRAISAMGYNKKFGVVMQDSIFEDKEKNLVIKLAGVGSTIDIDLSGKDANEKIAKEYYDNTLNDFDRIIKSYSDEKYFDDENLKLGEQALFEKINFSEKFDQKKTMQELCEEFKINYPKSNLLGNVFTICNKNPFVASSSDSNKNSVLINNKAYTISFEGIYKPAKQDYSAEIYIKKETKSGTLGPVKIELGKEEIYTLPKEFAQGEDGNPLVISLRDLDIESAKVDVNNGDPRFLKKVWDGITTQDTTVLKKDISQSVGNGYILTLTHVNLKKSAKVSVNPSIENAGTEVNFGFKIGIEKNSIELSPDKTKKLIDKLNKTITDWNEKSDKLGKAIKGFKTACLGTSAALVVQGFFSNLGGKSIARQEIMRGKGGWYEICTEKVQAKEYSTLNECLTKNSAGIEKDVDTYYSAMKTQEEKIKESEKPYQKTNGLTQERIIDDEKWAKDYFDDDWKNKLKTNLKNKFGSDTMVVNGDNVKIDDFVNDLDYKTTSTSELRSLELNSQLSGGSTLDARSKEVLKTQMSGIYSTTKQINEVKDFSSSLGGVQINSGESVKLTRFKFSQDVKFSQVQDSFVDYSSICDIDDSVNLLNSCGISPDSNVQFYKDLATSKEYMVVLDADNSVTRTFELDNNEDNYNLNEISNSLNLNPLKLGFQKVNAKTYQNKFIAVSGSTTPVVKYYETEPYKGLPAIVPFDLQNGWYAATKQTLPTLGGIKPVDASGRLTSFWVCNVGTDRIASGPESTTSDDICEQVNLATGQPVNNFPELDPTQSSKLIKDAQKAVEQAQKQYPSNGRPVNIDVGRGKYVFKVGEPAVNIPDVQCQDFMSPKQCQLLFNVCDPVICPSSRCDFGGTFPVTDVVQTGIVGSALLCLPNFREGIYVPVCLTGIKAGIDGYLSVLTSYRDCLQESLNTGQTVGICDEIYSIRLCDFFWRNAIPLAKLIIPKTLEFIMGQNVRGGGEYMGVQASWQNAEKSVNYITQYYAANSYKAFKARLSEGVTESVCQNFVSASYPDGGKIIDAMTDPDSPPQFHGRFDEIPFTDAVNPPISHYKVFYHVYAGKDSRAYYKIYLKGGSQSSYYQDTNSNLYVASGYIEKGGYASETKDFTATAGYKELCINVNGQEECGFKEVTTSAALDYIKDKYIEEQAKEKQVTTESECVSGSASLYSGLNLNAQAAAEEILNPAIYNRGIIRICATANPGLGSDEKATTNGSRWVPVGYCGNQKMICWLDTSNLKSLINSKTIENSLLEEQNENYQKILNSEGDYLDEAGFSQSVKEIKDKQIQTERIQLINSVLEKVFWNNQKGFLYLLRARAFSEMAIGANELVKKKKADEDKGIFEIDIHPFVSNAQKPFEYDFLISQQRFTMNFDKKAFGFEIKEEILGLNRLVGLANPENGIIVSGEDEKISPQAKERIKWLSENYLFLNEEFVEIKSATQEEKNKNAVRGFKLKASGDEQKINYFDEYSDLYIKGNQIFYSGGKDKAVANIKNGKIQPITDLVNLGFSANVFKIILSCNFVDGKFEYGGDLGGSEGASAGGEKINEEDYYTGGEDSERLREIQASQQITQGIISEIRENLDSITAGFRAIKAIDFEDWQKDNEAKFDQELSNIKSRIQSYEKNVQDYIDSLNDEERGKFPLDISELIRYKNSLSNALQRSIDYVSNHKEVTFYWDMMESNKEKLIQIIKDIESKRYLDYSCELDITDDFVVEKEISLFDFAEQQSGFGNLWPIWYYANEDRLENKDPEGGSLEIPAGTMMYPPCYKLPEGTERVLIYRIINKNLPISTAIDSIKLGTDYQVDLDEVKNLNPILSGVNLESDPDVNLNLKYISIPLVKKESSSTQTENSEEEISVGYVDKNGIFVLEQDTTIDKIAKQIYGDEDYWPVLYYRNKIIYEMLIGEAPYKTQITSEYLRKNRDIIDIVEDVPIYDNLGPLGFKDISVKQIYGEDAQTYIGFLAEKNLDKETFELFNPHMKGTEDSKIVEGFLIIPIK